MIASVHSSFRMSSDADDRSGSSRAIEHPLRRRHRPPVRPQDRGAAAVRVRRSSAVIAAAARTGTMLEINSSPDRRDLNEVNARAAAAAGVRIIINCDAHRVGGFEVARYGIATARRAWLTAERGRQHAAVGGVRAAAQAGARQARYAARAAPAPAARDRPRARRTARAAPPPARRSSGSGSSNATRIAPAQIVARRPAAGSTSRAIARARDTAPGPTRRHQRATVGQRLELGGAVVLDPRRGDEHPRASQERPVLRARQPARRSARPGPPAPSAPATTSVSSSRRAAPPSADHQVESASSPDPRRR